MEAYQDMVFSTAVRLLGNYAQAEDIAQEAFLKAFANFAQLQNSQSVGGWLKTVTTNLALNHLSRHRRRWRLFSELRSDDANNDAAELEFAAPDVLLEGIDNEQRHALIEQALVKLPEHQRVPLVLCHFQEMSYEDIAQRLQVSLAKVKVDIHRARVALTKQLMRTDLISIESKSTRSI